VLPASPAAEASARWKPGKTYKKAVSAAKTSGAATAAIGGPIAALFILIRGFSPESIPWEPEKDAALVAAVIVIIGPLMVFWRRWTADKAAHRE